MTAMFVGCITNQILEGDTSKVTHIILMFTGCENSTTPSTGIRQSKF
ncbi:MAG: hypothetical protein H0A75_00005 [Candidatus Methanofishera endochildressiae]|uniref:Uncharacterized protein n=1 Tax=Candidatus Methanofishera endochildressiae TaxID=2738884 RepID=A0A7Z0SD58_9GAMM|nr:hypothetical protein [Candidatus Methanofishera endochildressiae]